MIIWTTLVLTVLTMFAIHDFQMRLNTWFLLSFLFMLDTIDFESCFHAWQWRLQSSFHNKWGLTFEMYLSRQIKIYSLTSFVINILFSYQLTRAEHEQQNFQNFTMVVYSFQNFPWIQCWERKIYIFLCRGFCLLCKLYVMISK